MLGMRRRPLPAELRRRDGWQPVARYLPVIVVVDDSWQGPSWLLLAFAVLAAAGRVWREHCVRSAVIADEHHEVLGQAWRGSQTHCPRRRWRPLSPGTGASLLDATRVAMLRERGDEVMLGRFGQDDVLTVGVVVEVFEGRTVLPCNWSAYPLPNAKPALPRRSVQHRDGSPLMSAKLRMNPFPCRARAGREVEVVPFPQ